MLQNKTFNKIISVVIAVILWAYVIQIVNPTITGRITDIPVRIVNTENLTQRGLAIVGDGDYTVSITIEGRRTDVNNVTRDQITAIADVFGYTAGADNSVPVTVTLPDTVSLSGNRTIRIHVGIEELVTVHENVVIEYVGDLPANTEPGDITIEPSAIDVKGAKSDIANVHHVSAQVDASALSATGAQIVAAAVPVNADGERVEGVSLSANSVTYTSTLYYTREVPLDIQVIGEPSDNYEMTGIYVPETVTIRGTRSAISTIERVKAQPIDISDITATTSIPVVCELPEGVTLANASSNLAVGVGIKGLSEGDVIVTSDEILVSGADEGVNAEINTAYVKVTASGREAVVEELTSDFFELSVDVAGLETGMHEVPVLVRVKAQELGLKNVSVDPATVYVTISDIAEEGGTPPDSGEQSGEEDNGETA